jgi:transposase
MSIPIQLSESDFQQFINPYLSKAKRGYVSKIPLYKIFNYILYFLYTGCQWKMLPIEKQLDSPEKLEISWQAVYHHFRKWSRDGSLMKVFEYSVEFIKESLNLSELNFDGTHIIAKKGGQSVKYQGRKSAKTSNILPLTEKGGYILATTELVAGNHHDCYQLKDNLQTLFKSLKRRQLEITGAYFNADAGFDTKDARKVCFNHGLIPNIDENTRNRKKAKRGRKRFFDPDVYKNRFSIERTFAWVDKFKRLLIRFEKFDEHFMGLHFIAFALINLRNVIEVKV